MNRSIYIKEKGEGMKRRFYFITFKLIILVFISSCGSNSNDLFDDPFLAYMRDEGHIEYLKDEGKITPIVMPSGTEIWLDPLPISGTLAKDKQGSHAVLNVYFRKGKSYSWVIDRSISEKKQDLAYLGEYAIEYAKANGWKNDYDLYISVDGIYALCTYVYNYETNSLYIPSYEDMWIDAYQTCGTWSISELEKTSKGREWLILNGLGKMKHGEFESVSTSKDESYEVDVYEGEFREFGSNLSDIH